MLTTMHIQLTGNEDAQRLIGLLDEVGIRVERLRIFEALHEPEHRPDPVLDQTLKWALIGAVAGAAVGGVAMIWTSLPWVGALWGALVGAICFGRFKGNTEATHHHEDMRLAPTSIEFDTEDAGEIEHVHRIQRDHPQWAVTSAPTVLAEGAMP